MLFRIVLAGTLLFVAGCAAPGRTAAEAASANATAAESGFLTNHVQLTFADRFAKAGEAYFSPDANWIIFQAVERPPAGQEPSPHYAMYVARLRERAGRVVGLEEPIELSGPGSANTCGWFHPTLPGVVLFGSTMTPPAIENAPGYSRGTGRYTWEFPPEMDVVTCTVPEIVRDRVEDPQQRAALLARPDAGAPQRLIAHDTYCAEGSWSPDGRTILYTQLSADGDGDLYIYVVATGERRPIVIQPGYDGGPFFSPDGRFICYRSDRKQDNLLQIFVSELEFDADGLPSGVRNEYQLTDNKHVNWAPFWHPDGHYLIYATSEVSHRNYEVFAIPFDPANPIPATPQRVTRAEGFDGLPVFSPDRRFMMWTAQRGADTANNGKPSSQLWLAELLSSTPPALAPQIVGTQAAYAAPIAAALAAVAPEVRRYNDHVVTLANPFLEGRMPGTPGAAFTRDYIEYWMRDAGLEPAFAGAEGPSFRQPFEVRLASQFGSQETGPIVTAENVGGILRGRGGLADEFIVVGAHHDHLGRGRYGSRTGFGEIHEGADDNASGTAGVLLIAEMLAERYRAAPNEPRRSVLFLTFDAEEIGLNGSRHYVQHPVVPLDRHALMVNMDMIGRIDGGKLSLSGSNSGAGLSERIAPLLAASPLDVIEETTLPARSDHSSFYNEEIPVLFAIDGVLPSEYHTPDDESWRINRAAAVEAADLLHEIVYTAATVPARFAWREVPGAADSGPGPSMASMQVRFGIMPGNYNDPKPGVVVERVSPETSASRAGIRAGDRLVTWDGASIGGVSDWMTLMGRHVVGETVEVGVERDGAVVAIPVLLYGRDEG